MCLCVPLCDVVKICDYQSVVGSVGVWFCGRTRVLQCLWTWPGESDQGAVRDYMNRTVIRIAGRDFYFVMTLDFLKD